MLTDTVSRALSHLLGRPLPENRIKGHFRYAYASDDGRYVAIYGHDTTTYVVDVQDGRYCAERGVQPCGFAGHVLEVEDPRRHPVASAHNQFDLDLDAGEIHWRGCPGPGHLLDQQRAA
ncbi:hypothetical protein CEG14_05995 [Bordetella genomosp. 1]|uniref:Uncharacterized protein n=1 Tax=Bordetella genomosp. 1 TaxID=1395607 RepID=A0A261SQH2_9BORD|nr:hypothetical protein [Bordetella genomosp. 1]MDQ8033639.1 hypothetical protein [Bordetella sp.]OZI39080.1 hypothetical protein CEG14_05995 [Bordetella genomosp. 1]OZI65304.1 hypothetical protein CAL27_09670 [Bordetella genomosp. 1]